MLVVQAGHSRLCLPCPLVFRPRQSASQRTCPVSEPVARATLYLLVCVCAYGCVVLLFP